MRSFVIFFSILFFASQAAFAAAPKKASSSDPSGEPTHRGKKSIRSEAGLNIPAWGIAIDALYDQRLDNLIHGYKILNIVLSNRSPNTIYLDPQRDEWIIKDNVGKAYKAINHLRFESDNLWKSLPAELQTKLDYPHAVRTGNSTKVDVFFPAGVELLNFREIVWRSAHFKKEFSVYTSMEKDANDKEEVIPPSNRESYRKAMEKYEGEPTKARESDHINEPMPNERRPAPSNIDDFSIEVD